MSRILVIDDEPAFRKMVRTFLEAEGHEVTEAGNGDDGIAKFRATGPDLIVTDILMPGLNGIEAILKIREEQPDMKIIAVSGGTGGLAVTSFLTTAQEAGADRSLAKPFRRRELMETVEGLLAKDKR